MDTVGLIVALFVLISGTILGYLFSPRYSNKKNVAKQPPKVNGNLQKFAANGPMHVTLTKINKVTHDTYIFTYDLPDQDLPLGLHVGQHISIHATLPTKEFPEGEQIRRKYTPVSRTDQKGSFELLIKVYRKNVHPKFPEGGILSQHLETLQIGDKIQISGPLGKLSYHGVGHTIIERKEKNQVLKVREFGLIAGGTGITPMYQIIKSILDNSGDNTLIHVLFGNKTEDDILIRQELEGLSSDARVKIHFTVDAGTPSWKGFTGFVTKEMIQQTMPRAGKDVLICTCGPGAMNSMLAKQLAELGYTEDNIYRF